MALGHGAVWGVSYDGNQVLRIDLASNTVAGSIPVETPRDVVVTTDALWVLRDIGNSGSSEVLRIDPATNAVVTSITLEDLYGEWLRVEGGSVWVSTADGLIQIDATTGRLVTTITYPEPVRFAPAMAAGNGTVWVCRCVGQDDAVAWQLDANTGQWNAQVPVGTTGGDTTLVFFEGSLWRSHSAENTIVRSQLSD
jgi:hypothetical protein